MEDTKTTRSCSTSTAWSGGGTWRSKRGLLKRRSGGGKRKKEQKRAAQVAEE